MTRTWLALGVGALVAMTAGCAGRKQAAAPPPPPVVATNVQEGPSTVVREGTVTVSARVEDVDLKNRVVTLRGADGNVVDVQVGDQVKNLPQVHKGDDVVATYYESLALKLLKPGEAKPAVTAAEDVQTAKPGEKPAGTAARQVTVVATVVGLNKRDSTVTLKGPKGKTVTITARDPKRLETIKVGDLIEATYTEAVAISVEKAQPAAR